jgi:hypothetical protein
LTATLGGDDVTVSWTEPELPPESWSLEYSDTSQAGPWSTLTTGITSIPYVDTDAPTTVNRFYRCKSHAGGETSDPSGVTGGHKLTVVSGDDNWSVQVNDPDEVGVDSNDDLFWSTSTQNLTSSDASWGRTGSTAYRHYGAYFPYKGSPASAGEITVTSAVLSGFARGSSNTTDVRAEISMHDAIPATPPTTGAGAEALPRTTASTTWNETATWAASDPVSSPNFAVALQEIFDSYDVDSGDKLGVFVRGQTTTPVSGNVRTLSSANVATTSLRPTLTVQQSINTLGNGVAPNAPTAFAGGDTGGELYFTWTGNLEADLDHYELLQDGVVVSGSIGASATNTAYTPLDGDPHDYTLIAVDTGDNESDPSATVTSPFDIDDPVIADEGFEAGYRLITIDLDVDDDTGGALSPTGTSGEYTIATTDAAIATATSLNVTALPISLPIGTTLLFMDAGVAKAAELSAAADLGDTALSVVALADAIGDNVSTAPFTGVQFCVTTTNEWRFGLPLVRTTLAPDSWLTGAIFGLTPGTTYDVRAMLKDTVAGTEELFDSTVQTVAAPDLTETYAGRNKTLGSGGDWTTMQSMVTALNTTAFWTTLGANHCLIGVKDEYFLRPTTALTLPTGKSVTFKAQTNCLDANKAVNGTTFPTVYERFLAPHGVSDTQSHINTAVTPAWTEVSPGVWEAAAGATAALMRDASTDVAITTLQYVGYSTTKVGALTKIATWSRGKVPSLSLAIEWIQGNLAYNWGAYCEADGTMHIITDPASSWDPNDYYIWYSSEEIGTTNVKPGLNIQCPDVTVIGLRIRGCSEGIRLGQNALDCAFAYVHDDGNTAGIWGNSSSDVAANADRCYAYRVRFEDSSLWDEARPTTAIPWDLPKQWLARAVFAVTGATWSGGATFVVTAPGHDIVVGEKVSTYGGTSNAKHDRPVTAVTSTTITIDHGGATGLSASSTGGSIAVYYPNNQMAQKSCETQAMRAQRSGRFWHSEDNLYIGKFNGLGTSNNAPLRHHFWGWYSRDDEYTQIGDNAIEPERSAVCWVIENANLHQCRDIISTDHAFGPMYLVRSQLYDAGVQGLAADGSGGTQQYTGFGSFWKAGTDFQPSPLYFVLHCTFWTDQANAKGISNAIGGGGATEGYHTRNSIIRTAAELVQRNNNLTLYWDEDYNFWGTTDATAGIQIGTTYTTIAAYRSARDDGDHSNLIGATSYNFGNTGTAAVTVIDHATDGLTDVDTGDLTLTATSVFIDIGIPVPNVSDLPGVNFLGDAPDYGYEEKA